MPPGRERHSLRNTRLGSAKAPDGVLLGTRYGELMMPEWVGKLPEPDVLGIVGVFGIGGLIGITAIVSVMWANVRKAEVEANLKREMLDRGMSAEEIERVIKATAAGSEDGAPRVRRWTRNRQGEKVS
jgi:hypothetical protein